MFTMSGLQLLGFHIYIKLLCYFVRISCRKLNDILDPERHIFLGVDIVGKLDPGPCHTFLTESGNDT